MSEFPIDDNEVLVHSPVFESLPPANRRAIDRAALDGIENAFTVALGEHDDTEASPARTVIDSISHPDRFETEYPDAEAYLATIEAEREAVHEAVQDTTPVQPTTLKTLPSRGNEKQ